jgi:hypothetical protein
MSRPEVDVARRFRKFGMVLISPSVPYKGVLLVDDQNLVRPLWAGVKTSSVTAVINFMYLQRIMLSISMSVPVFITFKYKPTGDFQNECCHNDFWYEAT